MKLLPTLVLVAFLALIAAANADDEERPQKPKVQIGIKKRAANCDRKAKKGDFIHVHYRGTLQDDTEFDSSYGRGAPFTFTLGSNQVIKGWDQGLLGMCVGEKRRLVIPPELGYGQSGSGSKIPPNAVLIFEVEMVKITNADVGRDDL